MSTALEARIEAIDDKVDTLRGDLGRERSRTDKLENKVGLIEVNQARTDTTIKLWGKILLVGVPLLTSLGAWVVMRLSTVDLPAKIANAAVPTASASTSAEVAATPSVRPQPR